MRINDVDDWVRSVAHVVERFYPTAPAKATGLPLGAVFRQLVGLAHIGWLELAYEVQCNKCSVSIAVERIADPTILYEREYACYLCGAEVEVAAENVFPIFFVRGEWSDGLKKTPAASGRRVYPAGGTPIPLEGLNRIEKIKWSDIVARQEDMEALRKLASLSPYVEQLVKELDGELPLHRAERQNRLAFAKELGETVNEWMDVVLKVGATAAPYVAMFQPTVRDALEHILKALGLG